MPTPAETAAVKAGRTSAVVALSSFTATAPASGRMVAFWHTPEGRRIELGQFTARPHQGPQRVRLSLAAVASLLEEGQPLCVEVVFVDEAARGGGNAVVALEWGRGAR
ncbi:hypothetical protein OU995_15595 [Roseateles sp. SL47]|uniref:hypothetical protein n=1 Tax=Roseateles sp. SL47 TaxID=2995138 RepID=UPI00226F1794|nr:hypothetical protein [Roseateles sp. SL47]WAC71031.1 hypothetical protein OU995_15595 [Roseateles sp. SL47]